MINEKYTMIENIRVHYYENDVNLKNTLILHAFSFNAKTWVDLGTLDELEMNGFGSISLDFPGFGKSEKMSGLKYDGYPVKSDEGMEKVFIIEPERKIYSDWIINGCTFFPEPYGKIP